MKHYVALLRGINVGGNNLIRMPALKACFEAQGFRDVATYIQSGNVLFAAGRGNQKTLTARIEAALSTTFAYRARIVLRSSTEMTGIVNGAPRGFGSRPTDYRYDVIFLKEPLTSEQALAHVSAKDGVDAVAAGEGVLYFSRLISKATQSRLGRLVSTPVYKDLTIRNWNTTVKLKMLLEAREVDE